MALENLEKHTRKFIEGLMAKKAPPLYTLSPMAARKVLDDVQSGPVSKLPVHMEDKIFPCGPDHKVAVRIIRPQKSEGTLPVILFCHGGGWILGNVHTHDRLVRELAVGANAAVVFVQYTPSPEAQFPKPIDEAFGVLEYLVKHGAELHLDARRLAIVGDSVGGNMTIALTLLAKEKKHKVSQQVLFYPVTDGGLNTGSYQTFAEGPWLTKKAMEWFWNAYAPHPADRKKILVSPLHAPQEALKGLPPALVITAENDVLRDEGEAYAHRLMQSDVPVTAIRFLGTMHDFVMLNDLSHTPATVGAIACAVHHLKKALHSSME